MRHSMQRILAHPWMQHSMQRFANTEYFSSLFEDTPSALVLAAIRSPYIPHSTPWNQTSVMIPFSLKVGTGSMRLQGLEETCSLGRQKRRQNFTRRYLTTGLAKACVSLENYEMAVGLRTHSLCDNALLG